MKNLTHQKRLRWVLYDYTFPDGIRRMMWHADMANGFRLSVEPGPAGMFLWRVDGFRDRLYRSSGLARSLPLAKWTARRRWLGIAMHEGWKRRPSRRLRSGHNRRWRHEKLKYKRCASTPRAEESRP